MRFERKYSYSQGPHWPRHEWLVVGARMAITVWISVSPDSSEFGPTGGIEIHYRSPPDYMKNDSPSHSPCPFLGAPCWHDGSSLQASEKWIPMWEGLPHDHDGMLNAIQNELIERDGGYGED